MQIQEKAQLHCNTVSQGALENVIKHATNDLKEMRFWETVFFDSHHNGRNQAGSFLKSRFQSKEQNQLLFKKEVI